MCSKQPRTFAMRVLGASCFALALTGAAMPFIATAQTPTAGEVRPFNVAAGPLPEALTALAAQAGIALSFDPTSLANKQSQGLRGEYSLQQGFARLLAGTGYELVEVSGGEYMLRALQVTRLGPITVTARRTPQSISTIPGAVTVVDRTQIEEQLRVTADVGRILEQTVPGIVGVSRTRQQPSTIRGRSALVLVNGVPQNTQQFSAGFEFQSVDANLIERIEVVRGANATYGFGGTGGVINIITRRPESEEPTFTTRLGTRFQPLSIDRDTFTKELYQDVSGKHGRFDYFFGGSFRRLERAYDGDGDVIPDRSTEFNHDIFNLNANLEFEIDADQSLRLTANYFRDQARSGGLTTANGIPGERKADAVPYPDDFIVADGKFPDPQTATTAELEYANNDVFGSSISTQLFVQEFNEKLSIDFRPLGCCDFAVGERDITDRRIGFRANVDTPIDLGSIPDGARVTWGLDYLNYFSRFRTDSIVADFDVADHPDITQDSIAGFAQVEAPVGDFLLTGGVRHERFFIDIDDAVLLSSTTVNLVRFDGGSLDYDSTLFNAGLVYYATDEIELFAAFNQGFDVTQIGRAAQQVTSADQIEPEPAVTDSYELGVRIFEDRWQASLTGFYTESDLASRTINPADDGIENAVPLRQPEQIWGIEATVDVQPVEEWRFGSTFTWQDGDRETEEGKSVPIQGRFITPFRLTGYAEYSPVYWATGRLQFSWTPGHDRFPDSTTFGEGEVDSVFLVDVSAGFDVGPGQLNVGIENLLNEQYIPVYQQALNSASQYYAAPGLTAAVSYQFEW